MAKYAGVIVDISLEKLDRVFDYKIPARLEEMIYPGVPVWIPFALMMWGREGRLCRRKAPC